MKSYSLLLSSIKRQVDGIDPSFCHGLVLHPCDVTLSNGRKVHCVTFADGIIYDETIGIPNAELIDPLDLASVSEAALRLPSRFATQLYMRGESGMGYTAFTICYKDGNKSFHIGYASLDYVRFPEGLSGKDVKSIRNTVRNDDRLIEPPPMKWCLYSC